jgi:hypothetical protein
MLRYEPLQDGKTLRRMAYAGLAALGLLRSRGWYDQHRKNRYLGGRK